MQMQHSITNVDPVDTAIALVLAVLLIAAVIYGLYCAVVLLSPEKARSSKKTRYRTKSSAMTDSEAEQIAIQATVIAASAAIAASTTITH